MKLFNSKQSESEISQKIIVKFVVLNNSVTYMYIHTNSVFISFSFNFYFVPVSCNHSYKIQQGC